MCVLHTELLNLYTVLYKYVQELLFTVQFLSKQPLPKRVNLPWLTVSLVPQCHIRVSQSWGETCELVHKTQRRPDHLCRVFRVFFGVDTIATNQILVHAGTVSTILQASRACACSKHRKSYQLYFAYLATLIISSRERDLGRSMGRPRIRSQTS
jgi:hypothetical protein